MKRKDERHTGVGRASISLFLISAHSSPEILFFCPKWLDKKKKEERKKEMWHCSVSIFCLGWAPFSLSLKRLIMMSVLCYLLGSAWLLISDQQSSATPFVTPAWTTAELVIVLLFSFFLFQERDFLLFLNRLKADSKQTQPDPFFWTSQHNLLLRKRTTKQNKPRLGTRMCFSNYQKNEKPICLGELFFFFPLFFATSDTVPLCQTISLFSSTASCISFVERVQRKV